MVNKIFRKITIRNLKNNYLQYLAVIIIGLLSVTLFIGLTSSYKGLDKRKTDLYNSSNMYDCLGVFDKEVELNDNLNKRYVMPINLANQKAYLYIVDNPTIAIPKDYDESLIYVSRTLNVEDTLSFNILNYEVKISEYVPLYHPEAIINADMSSNIIYITKDKLKELINVDVTLFIPTYQIVAKNLDKTDLINLGAKEAYNLSDMPFDLTISSEVSQSTKLTYVFPVVFLLTAILIIITTASQMINKERHNIACLKSLGVSNTKITLFYIRMNCILSLIGAVLGIIIGPLLIPKIYGIKFDVLYQIPKSNIIFPIFESILITILLVLSSAIISILAIRKIIKLNPSEALRGEVKLKLTKSKNNLPFSLKIALRNIKNKFSRSIMVVLGLMGCSALLIVGYGITDTIDISLEKDVYELFKRDYVITYNNPSSNYHKLDFEKKTEYRIENVELTNSNYKKSTQLYRLSNNETLGFEIKENEVVLSKLVAEKLNVAINESIEIDGTNYKVFNIIESSITNGAFILDENTLYDFCFVLGEGNKELDFIKEYQSTSDWFKRAEDTVSSIKIITLTLKVFAYLLAVVVLYNLALLNFKERSRDLATMKVIGLRQREIEATVLIEMTILTVIGVIFGLILSYPMLTLILNINKTEVFNYIISIKPISYVIGALMTILTSLLVNYILCKLIKKIPMVESLKSVE